MTKIKDFRDLVVWNKGMEVVKDIYRASRQFPKDELYGLSSQMRRSAVSVPANIAEGFNRKHNKEYKQFLYVALGSCAELETHVEVASGLGYLSSKEDLLCKIQHESRMLTSLISKIK